MSPSAKGQSVDHYADGRRHVSRLAGVLEGAGVGVDREDGERVAVAAGGQQPAAGRVEVEVAGPAAADRFGLDKRQLASRLINRERGDRVVPAVGRVDELARRVDADLRAAVERLAGDLLGRERRDRLPEGQLAPLGVPVEDRERHRQFVDDVADAQRGVELEVPRASAGDALRRAVLGQLAGLRVQLVDVDPIGAQVGDEHKPVVGRHAGPVRVASLLATRHDVRRIVVLQDRNPLGNRAVLIQPIRTDRPAAILRAEQNASRLINRHVARPAGQVDGDGLFQSVAEAAPETPAELVAIIERTLSADPALRYPSAEAFSADLASFLERKPVQAHAAKLSTLGSASYPLRLKLGRNKKVAALGAVAALLLVGGVFLISEFGRARQAAQVLRLSALQDLEDLIEEANDPDLMWPAHPAQIPVYERWLARARALIASLPEHEEHLRTLRKGALERTAREIEHERRADPRWDELEQLEKELSTARQALAQLRDGVRASREAAWKPQEHGDLGMSVAEAVALVDPQRGAAGGEVEALQILEGLSVTAPEQLETPLAQAALARAYLALGRDEEAREAAAKARHLAGDQNTETDQDLIDAIEAATTTEAGRLESVEAEVVRLESEHEDLMARIDERDEWRYADGTRSGWWDNQLAKLVEGLKELSIEESSLMGESWLEGQGLGVTARLKLAEQLERDFAPGTEFFERWEAALPRMREVYPGIDLSMQLGLVPIGPDPRSGLWEFWHVPTGAEPQRGTDGKIQRTEAMGIVLVLLRGGRFWMGSQSTDPDQLNYSSSSIYDERPVHVVRISPFFMSKYEVTQSQWMRLTGSNPSRYPAGTVPRGSGPVTLLNPVEFIDRHQAAVWLRTTGLTLPSEAQWEYACRAGTTTEWWTGSDPREAFVDHRIGNIADQASVRWHSSWEASVRIPELDDGHAVHAEVGTFEPNPFGLHDPLGNVWEWCLDAWGRDTYVRSALNDPVGLPTPIDDCIYRGGSFRDTPSDARAGQRDGGSPSFRYDNLGVRAARRLMP